MNYFPEIRLRGVGVNLKRVWVYKGDYLNRRYTVKSVGNKVKKKKRDGNDVLFF